MTVISLTAETSHTIQMLAHGKFACCSYCPHFKEFSMCKHTPLQQQAKQESWLTSWGLMNHLLNGWSPTYLQDQARKTKKRPRKDHPTRDVQEYKERVATGSQKREEEEEAPYELVFEKDTSATTCYGCKGWVQDKPSSRPPPSPFDLFIRHCERRTYKKRKSKIRISRNPELVYFHPTKASCASLSWLVIREGRFSVDSDTKTLLNNNHKQLLFTEFGFSCD